MVHSRFSIFTFKNGKTARNRMVIPPMASQTADSQGNPTQATFEHYRRLGEAQVGIVFVEYSYIHQTGKSESNQLAASQDGQILGLSRIAKIIQAAGSLAGLQIVHAGGKTSSQMTGSEVMGPSAVTVPVKDLYFEPPTPMTDLKINQWIEWFVAAARRADQAGFDFVELHAAHGYGLNQWLSPITNQRDDSFGGDIQGRSRMLLEIVGRIKKSFPGLLVSVRLPAQDNFENGLNISDMTWVVQKLEELGVDLIDVSSGIGGWRRPKNHIGEGYLVSDAAQLKATSRVPIIGVGGIETGKYIDKIVGDKKVDFAAIGRAILKDPSDWARRQQCV